MPKKSLGQHWLTDREVLQSIADTAELTSRDTVLEIGPGLGTLTSVLLRHTGRVVAVEYDGDLARKLPGQFPGTALEVVAGDILTYDLGRLPSGYKVVANVPYYITQKIVEWFLRAENQPEVMALLVQKEVAEKLAAKPGDLTTIAVQLQSAYNIQLGPRVPKEYFTPSPKVDSQVVVCKKHQLDKYAGIDRVALRRVLRAGFSAPRKKLRSSLAGGLQLEKAEVERYLTSSGISLEARAADVSVEQWVQLSAILTV